MNRPPTTLPVHQKRFLLVWSRFNSLVTKNLLEGAQATLLRQGVPQAAIEVQSVPGAFELPLAVKKRLSNQTLPKVAAVVALGAVIKGNTAHHEYISAAVIQSLLSLSLHFQLPVALGVLTTDTLEQAMERAGAKLGNKGEEAALSAFEML